MQRVLDEVNERGLAGLASWLHGISESHHPSKSDQDELDACICLLVALYMIECRKCLVVGSRKWGYMVVPYGEDLYWELCARCRKTGREPTEWVRSIELASRQN